MAADEGKERWMNRRRRKINKAKEKKKEERGIRNETEERKIEVENKLKKPI